MFCNKSGKLFICCALTILVYLVIIKIQNASNDKVIAENEENKAKSLHFFIDI